MCGRGRLARGREKPLIEAPTNSGSVSICTFPFVSILVGLAKGFGTASWTGPVEFYTLQATVDYFGRSLLSLILVRSFTVGMEKKLGSWLRRELALVVFLHNRNRR